MTLDRDERAERQDTARAVLRVGTGLILVTLVVSLALAPLPLAAHAPYAAMAVVHVLTLLLVGWGHLRFAVGGFAACYLAVILAAVAHAGGQIAPAGFALPPIVLFVGLTLSGRAALGTAIAASAGVLGVVLADNAGALPDAPLVAPVRLWLVATTSSLITGAMLYAALRIIRESRQRTATAQQARQELEARLVQTRRLETVGRLAAGVAHDFNNVLTVIFAEASRLARGDARTAASAANIRAAADRAAALARQLLAVGRRQVREPERMDLAEVVRQFAGLLDRLVGDDVRLVLDVAADVPAVEVDRLEAEQVLLNLVTNARDAMPRGGTLTVGVAVATPAQLARGPGLAGRRGVALRVQDTGAGIPADVRERLFEPFFTTKPIGHGTGLGLATVAAIAAQAGGAVLVDSAPGAGATFTMVLPEAPASAVRRDRAAAQVGRRVRARSRRSARGPGPRPASA